LPTSTPTSTDQPAGPRASFGTGLLLTAVAWVVSRFVVGVAWGPTRNPFQSNPNPWARWDTFNYLAIAEHGRTFAKCSSPAFVSQPNPLSQIWCGTAGWLPGYPWLIKVGHMAGLGWEVGGLLISWVALAVTLFLVWWGWGRDLSPGRALAVLLLFGLFPGAVYNFAIFPTSLALALVVGAILAAAREHYVVGALLLTAAGLCYPSAWFAAAGLAVGLVIVAVPLGADTVIRRAFWGAAGLASLVVLVLHDQFAFQGKFNAYFVLDTQPGLVAPGFPGEEFLRLLFTHNTLEQKKLGTFAGTILSIQAVITVLLTAAAAVVTGVQWRRRVRDPLQIYPALVGVAVVLLVLFHAANGGAWNRSIVLAAPGIVCLRRIPLPLLWALVAIAGVVTALLSRSFFANTLV
jgi:hypothetical protein